MRWFNKSVLKELWKNRNCSNHCFFFFFTKQVSFRWIIPLTVIGPGEVKVDLADFDLKLQENLLKNLIFKKYLFLQKRLPSLFEILTWPQKMTFWLTFWQFFVRIPAAAPPWRPPPSASQHSNQFPVTGRVECGGWRVCSRACVSRSF
jgi:hypothetical protein